MYISIGKVSKILGVSVSTLGNLDRDEIAKNLDITSSQLIYAYTLQIDYVSVALMSTRKPERIEQNIIGCDITLEEDILKQINVIFPPKYTGI